MTHGIRDIVLSLGLLSLASIWTYLVIDTIPPGFGHGDIGPRAFPMVLGFVLAGLSALLLIRALLLRRAQSGAQTADWIADPEVGSVRAGWGPMVLVAVEIAAYGFLLEKLGFLLATPLLLLFVLVIHLRLTSWKTVLGMTFGMTLGCWLIFEKLLGIYLANGSWLNIG